MSEWIDLLDSENHTFDNTTSGLTAVTVKTALDEINTAVTTNTTKVSAAGSIDAHSDVDTTTAAPSTGDYLEWDGGNWAPGTPSDDVTLVTTSHDYLSLAGQAITLGAIELATDVTGTLPAANVAFGTGTDSYVWTSDGAGGAAWEASPSGGWVEGTVIDDWGLTNATIGGTSPNWTWNWDNGHIAELTLTADATITISTTQNTTEAKLLLTTAGFTPTFALAGSTIWISDASSGWATNGFYVVMFTKVGTTLIVVEQMLEPA